MPESNTILGFLMSAVFALLGFIGLVAPAFVHRLAQRTTRDARLKGQPIPFAGFVDSPHYSPALRVLGAACLVVAVLLLTTTLVELLAR
jgi:hypothetical protein